MYTRILIQSEAQLQQFCQASYPEWPALKPEMVQFQQADCSWLVYDCNGQIAARCSLWWNNVPTHHNHRVGLIGHFAARDQAVGTWLLNEANMILAALGCTLAVGPMDGSTWFSYRLMTDRGNEPAFFLEPHNPDTWPDYFRACGFAVQARYVSALNPNLDAYAHGTQRGSRLLPRLEERGIRLRSLTTDEIRSQERYASLLQRIYAIACESFRRNPFYSAISQDAFIALYLPLQPYIHPDLIWVAEQEGEIIGFCFALPDLLQTQQQRVPDTLIIKTVAVLPAYEKLGIGVLLTEYCQKSAARIGYKRAIHALMHVDNHSLKTSTHTGQPLRQYALFGKSL